MEIRETEATIQAGPRGPVMNKSDMAIICDVGVEDKCWAIPLSMKKWPWNLELCNHFGEAGHEHYDSAKHTFSKSEMEDLRELIRETLAGNRLASEK